MYDWGHSGCKSLSDKTNNMSSEVQNDRSSEVEGQSVASKSGRRDRRRSIVIIFLVTAVILLSIFSRIDNWKRDLTTNFARLDAASSDADLRPLQVERSPEAVAESIEAWVDTTGNWQVISRRPLDRGVEMELTRTTALMRFTDDVKVNLDSKDGGTYVRAQSQSRIGKGDLGQNPRNLKELTTGIKAGL